MRKFTLLSILVALIASLFAISSPHSTASAAQATPVATPNADCDASKLLDVIAKIKKTGDKDKDTASLDIIQNGIADYKAACAGLSWKGTKQQVIRIPGIYYMNETNRIRSTLE